MPKIVMMDIGLLYKVGQVVLLNAAEEHRLCKGNAFHQKIMEKHV
jgi:hypothetical protein